MDIKKLTQEVLLKNMTPEQQLAVLESVTASVKEAKAVQKQKIAENVDLVLQALKRIEADMLKRVDGTAKVVEDRVKTIKDGKDGQNGKDGKPGKDGRDGKNGLQGPRGFDGKDGKDGRDGVDGVSVTDAHIDFDGSLIITLSTGKELNVGEVLPMDMAEKIKVIGNGGGTSQFVLDTLADLQTQINNFVGGLTYKGSWNASTNSPTLTSSTGTNSWYYVVSVAGSTNLNGITDWQVGDWAIFNGTVWQKIDQTNTVTSVAGRTGDVTLTSTDVGLANVENKSSATIRSEITSTNVTTALGYTPYNATNPNGYTSNTGTVTSVAATAGTGISVTGSPITSSGTLTITNTAPDQTVVLTAGTGISTTGTYPNFTITNSSPDQTVAITGSGTTSVTGTYPNFTVSSADQYVGTVTSVNFSGGTTGLTTSGGPVTSSGTITLSGTLALANGGTGATTVAAAQTNLQVDPAGTAVALAIALG